MSSAICFNLDQSKILSSGNGLNTVVSIHELTVIVPDLYFCRLHSQITIGQRALEGISLKETNYRKAQSVKKDHTARMCRLILLYTLRKINPL